MFQWTQKAKGFSPVFRSQVSNMCPGCGRSHWYVGRATAECAFCGTALPIAESHRVILADDGAGSLAAGRNGPM